MLIPQAEKQLVLLVENKQKQILPLPGTRGAHTKTPVVLAAQRF